jgi:purine-binding chemotaxis protein CheW
MDNGTTAKGQYLTFFVAGEEYAIGILRIKEIIEFSGATRVPGTPSSVVGVINLRGRVVPVVDLAKKFGSPATVITARSCAVIVELEREHDRLVTGLVADAVHEVIEMSDDSIEPPPAFGTRVRIDFLRGIGRHGERFVLLLDVDRLLDQSETAAAETTAATEELAVPA